MRASDLKKYEGKVVVLDLINGVQATTFISSVSDDGVVTTKDWIVFQVQVVTELKDQTKAPTPDNIVQKGVVSNTPYGAPLYQPRKRIPVDASHILGVFDCPDQMADAYSRVTSNLVLAGAGTMNQLPPANKLFGTA